jgi:hypothetical protein|tara:strand:- start:4432 stop:5259 length:828 start_codon:yes stop_codon:yes gene_type:complete
MVEVKLLDVEFEVGNFVGNGNLNCFHSPHMKWYRGDEERPVCIFTDRMLNRVDSVNADVKIAWLLEPKAMAAHNYEFVRKYHHKFDYIITYEDWVEDFGDKVINIMFGGCWIDRDECYLYPKTKNVSIIASSKTWTVGHRLRHEVISDHRSKFDAVYGRGHNPIDSKLDGLKDFRYSIVIENSISEYYITEKIMDCFVTGTIPIYWGSPRLGEFFDERGIIRFNSSEELGELLETLSEEDYNSRYEFVKKNYIESFNYVHTENIIYSELSRRNVL